MAAPSLTYTLTNGTTADASQVMQNFNDLLNGITDGTKDLSISALTCAGALTANGNVNLGNSSGDDITVTGSLASTIPIKTTNTYDIGSTTLGLRKAYFGANSQTVAICGSGSMSATWTLTLPVSAGTANHYLSTDGSGNTSWAGALTDWSSNFTLAVNSGGGGVANVSGTSRYIRIGNSILFFVYISSFDVTGATSVLQITLPVAAKYTSRVAATYCSGSAQAIGRASTTAASTTLAFGQDAAGGGWPVGTGYIFSLTFWYEANS